MLGLPVTLAAVSMAAPNMTPDWLKAADFSLFPSELTPFFLYMYAMHLRNIGETEGMFYTAQSAISMCVRTNTFTWLDLNLLLLCAVGCYKMNDEKKCDKYLSAALELGMPCGFYMPFAETLGEFGGRMETLLEQKYPDKLKAITLLWNNSFKNWIDFHNRFTKENIATILTAQEYQVAHCIVHGVTCAQTAARMKLSVGRVKNVLSDVYSKLYI